MAHVPVAKLDLPPELERALSPGIEEREGCLLLVSQWTPSTVEDLQDRTGYEAFVNHLHIDVDDGSALALAVGAADRIESMIRSRNELEDVRIVISAESPDSATIRFHRVRQGESWRASDIDGYAEPVVFRDVGRASSEGAED